jgi:hypothetical protein
LSQKKFVSSSQAFFGREPAFSNIYETPFHEEVLLNFIDKHDTLEKLKNTTDNLVKVTLP